MRRTVVICVLIEFMACTVVNRNDGARLAKVTAERVAAADIRQLVNAFHYPPEETLAERSADKQGVEAALRVLFDDFGKVRLLRETREVPYSVEASVGGGNLKYWAKHTQARRFFYEVEFATRGSGWIFVDVVGLNRKSEVRLISFALPANRIGAREDIDATFKKLLSTIQPEKPH